MLNRVKIAPIAFVAIGLALVCSMHFGLVKGLRRVRNGDFGVWNALVSGNINADILVVGGSRALVDVDCVVISQMLGMSCFNIGLDGSPHNLQHPMLETYLAHNRAPRIAILSADISSLALAHGAYKPHQYLPYLDEEPLFANLQKLDPEIWKERYLPLFGFAHHGLELTASAIHGLLGGSDPAAERRTLGQLPVDLLWDGAFDNFMREVGAKGKVFPVEQPAVDVVAGMITMLRTQGTRVALFYSPEWKEMHRFELNRAEVLSRYRATAAANGAAFWDYSESPLSRDRSYFYNSQHMNRRGATMFSRALAKDLEALQTSAR